MALASSHRVLLHQFRRWFRSKERPTLGTMQRNLTMLPRGAVKGVLVRLI